METKNERLLKLLNISNIEITDALKDGELKELSLTKLSDGLKGVLVISLPKVIDIKTVMTLRHNINQYMLSSMNFREFELKIEFVDGSIDNKCLEDYYNYILNILEHRHARFGVLTTIKKDINNNVIKFFVGSGSDKEIIDELLKVFDQAFKSYCLNVSLVCEVSPFEISTQTKIEKRIEQIDLEVKKRQEYYDSIGQVKKEEEKKLLKKPKLKNPINGEVTPLNKLPSTDVEVIEYQQLHTNTEFVVIADVMNVEEKEITAKSNGAKYHILSALLSDDTSSITAKTFLPENRKELADYYRKALVKGQRVRIYGNASYDKFARDVVLNIQDCIAIEKEEKKAVEVSSFKRVELHAHTKMSTQDSVMEVEDYVKRASEYGYTALAITDHYNIQALPDFYSACKSLNIKPIFGVEGELVDENKFRIALNDVNEDINLADATYVVFDIETTGLSSIYNEIIEISACKVLHGSIIDEFSEYVKPKRPITKYYTDLTSITNDDVRNAESIEQVLPRFKEFFDGCILVAHNATFDCSYIYENLRRLNMYEGDLPTIDTLQLARVCYGDRLKRFDLKSVSKFFDVELTQHHRAIYDAMATAHFFIKMLNGLLDKNIRYYNEINTVINVEEAYKLSYPTHFTILSKNQTGKKNLYKIISDSHTVHFHKQPRILKSFLEQNREGLLIGSGCVNGDIFMTAYEKSYDELKEKMKFYDYIELQPLELYDVLINDEDSIEEIRRDLKNTVKTIVKAASELNIPVVATSDIHHLVPEDKKFREIYINAPMIGGGRHPLADCKHIPSFHFRSTEELLENFSFLGSDKAMEIVVDNTLKIAEQISDYELFPNKLFSPQDDFLADKGIPSVAKKTEEMCYERARELYGENLPQIVDDRLKKELNSIVGNLFAPIYYIAYMLVKYSTDAGYVVGSRGSVGSSLVAYMMKITEVNSLPPHYFCPHCHFSAFKLTEDEKIKYPLDENQQKFDEILQAYGTGFDLPEARCPICGEKLNQNGVDIPFETFLGFDGTKTPDIDLNFSGDFQPQAHLFCREVFGYDRAFRAGTIGTIAENTAIGYVKGYLERTGQHARQSEIIRLAQKIEGVKRTTGQHPGGIVVLPKDIEYTDIVPIQYPADDVTAEWRTTHFDYHKFEHNLLKLDILGHDDPTMIRHLMDFVEKYPDEFPFKTVDEIPLTDVEVFKLFNGLESLKLDPSQTFGVTIGTTGIPEFGTKMAKDMLNEIRPTTVDDLLKISGLSHGTDVWNGNARDFMLGTKEGFGKIPFKELIGCRDDIMVYLMKRNLPAIDSFKIMESVRKGRGLTPKMEEEMAEYNIPKWYVESCKLIKYMFPKAHATAYVIMALRIGWFKVHRPIFYYAGFFSRRADGYDVEAMAGGFEAIKAKLVEIQEKKDNKTVSNKENDVFDTLLLALEMTARGMNFVQMDIKESEAINFKVSDDRKSLLIPFGALDGLGESIAKSIVEARTKSSFTSKKDVLKRTKMNNTQFEKMNAMGVFGDLPEDDQIGLFQDFD